MAVVCLDLDGTLLDGSHFPQAIANTCRALAQERASLDADQLLVANARIWQRYFPAIESAWQLGAIDGRGVSREAWRRTLADCQCHDAAIVERALALHLEFSRATYRLFDDVERALDALTASGARLALVTNGSSDTQREKIEVLGLEKWFDAIVVSGELGYAKPHPAVFDTAFEMLGGTREHAMHVGDSLGADVAGAQAARIRGIWLNRTGRARSPDEPHPDIEIASLDELL